MEDGKVKLLSSLKRHLAPVNCVRFSPDYKLLASGSDDGFVILWKLDDNSENINTKPLEEQNDDEPPNVCLETYFSFCDIYYLLY